MKRFTETQKWDDGWFRRLSPAAKLLWQWLCDKCDSAGVIEPDLELASFQIGMPITDAELGEFGNRVVRLASGKLHLPKFIEFQYGTPSRDCKAHRPIFLSLQKHFPQASEQRVSKGFQYPLDTVQEKEKEKEKEKATEKVTEKEPVKEQRAGGALQELVPKVNSLRPEWKKMPHLSAMEMHTLQGCAHSLECLTETDWQLMREFLAYAPRGAEKPYQVRSREKFLQTPVDTLTAATEWQKSQGNSPTKLNGGKW
jgi:hypothetical protein